MENKGHGLIKWYKANSKKNKAENAAKEISKLIEVYGNQWEHRKKQRGNIIITRFNPDWCINFINEKTINEEVPSAYVYDCTFEWDRRRFLEFLEEYKPVNQA